MLVNLLPAFLDVLSAADRRAAWRHYFDTHRPVLTAYWRNYVLDPESAHAEPVIRRTLDADRADLLAILLTGIPAGLIDGFQNFTGPTQADELRLNVAIPPSRNPSRLGLLGGDLAGFPNGRRVADDVVTIELRAVAGATYPLVDPNFTPDDAVSVIEDGTFQNPGRDFLDRFPYVGLPYSGFDVPAAAS